YCRDQPVRSYAANAMIAGISNIKAPVRPNCYSVRKTQLGLSSGARIAAVPSGSAPSNCADVSQRSNSTDPVIEGVSNIKAAVRSHGDAARASELGLSGWA